MTPGEQVESRADLRVLAYNVRSLRDGRHRAPAVVRACAPDLVLVQEAPRFVRWRARCAALARESGLVVVTGGRTAGGVLLLASVRVGVLHAEDVLLTPSKGLHRRGVAMAVVDVQGRRLVAASIHLGLALAERLRHVDEVEHHLARLADRFDARRVLVAGDVNEPAGGRTWQVLAGRLGDAYARAPWGGRDTFPATAPDRRIDGVLVGPGLTVLRCGVPSVPDAATASDHLPVLADLRLGQAS